MTDSKINKPEKFLQKLWEFLCCQQGIKSCCDCHWFQEKKISKSDIQHPVNKPRIDSTSSHSDSIKSRDRVDSIDSRARTDSTSSTGTLMGDYRRAGKTPIIDMKPIEFWAANRESIQPRPKRRHPSETEISVENFQRELYEVNKSEGLTDEQKLVRYQLGQIHFGLQYDVSEKVLMVKMIEAKDLPAPYCLDKERQDMARSNPYCKISLLPDQKNSQQSTVQRKTQNPTWNEYFMFEIPYKEAQLRILEILVKDFDKYSRHCVIGQFHLALNSVKLIKGGHMWKPLSPSSKERHELGEILLSLNYLPTAGRINVDIIKAKQLLQTDMVGGSDPFVKVTLTLNDKTIKCKKTTCKKNTIDPVFNESINFNVSPRQLANASLVVSVWDYNSKSKDDFVGRIVLGKMATGPHEITHWSRMVQSQRSAIAQWHVLRSRQECDAVSAASIAVP